MQPDPNADLLANVRAEMVQKFRASNPKIYDGLSKAFNESFGQAVRQGVGIGLDLALTVVNDVIATAEGESSDISAAGWAYLNAIPGALEAAKVKALASDGVSQPDKDAGSL